MRIALERAKDNDFTCTVEDLDGKRKYVYSKYKPKNVKINGLKAGKTYIVLGLGLGYEVNLISKNTSEKIYVVEPTKEFYNIIKENEELYELVRNKNIIFLFGEDYKNISFSEEYEIVNNENITKYNNNYFIEVLSYFNN